MIKQHIVTFHPTPGSCDVCGGKLAKVMYDAKTRNGQWGCLCHDCFHREGGKLGTGLGQKYHWTGTAFQTDMADPKMGGH